MIWLFVVAAILIGLAILAANTRLSPAFVAQQLAAQDLCHCREFCLRAEMRWGIGRCAKHRRRNALCECPWGE